MSGWICPRCGLSHSLLVQTCGCAPATVTVANTMPMDPKAVPMNSHAERQMLEERLRELERRIGAQGKTLFRRYYALVEARELLNSTRDLMAAIADQDCESWGCDTDDPEHSCNCDPAIAREMQKHINEFMNRTQDAECAESTKPRPQPVGGERSNGMDSTQPSVGSPVDVTTDDGSATPQSAPTDGTSNEEPTPHPDRLWLDDTILERAAELFEHDASELQVSHRDYAATCADSANRLRTIATAAELSTTTGPRGWPIVLVEVQGTGKGMRRQP